jgi:hypothetical protein
MKNTHLSQLAISTGYDINFLEDCLDHVIYSRRFNVSNDDIVEELICDFEISRQTANNVINCA